MRKQILLTGVCFSALILTAAAAPADVRSLHHREVDSDRRAHLFSGVQAYQIFSTTGATIQSVPLEDPAVNGGSLVTGNLTVADFYFSSHDAESNGREASEPDEAPFEISWKSGKTTIRSQGHELKISNRIQFRFSQEDDAGGDSRGSFQLRRAKTKFEGWAFDERLTYALQMNFASSSPLEDAWVDYDLSGEQAARIRVGRFKAPFGRQELTSSGSQEFVDRSIVSAEFADGRDNGVMLHGSPGRLDWAVGIFNGAGRTASSNDNNRFQYNARAVYSILGREKTPSEVDFESDGSPILAIGVGYHSNDKHGASPGNDIDREIVSYDVLFKLDGFFAFVEIFDASNRPESGARFDQDGLHAQAGYLFDGKFDVAIRFAAYDPSSAVVSDDRTETGIAFGYFWHQHSNKLQADYREIEDDASGATRREIRVQYQIVF